MELSLAPGPELQEGSEQKSEEPSCGAAPLRPMLFDVPVPSRLGRFGARVPASALGDPRNPVVVVLGGISANCFPGLNLDGSAGWWAGLAGAGRAVDPARHYVIGVGFAADETGAIAPTTAEQAEIVACALDAIGIERKVVVVGASYGAMVGLALAETAPERVEGLVLISGPAEPHPQSTAVRELQRRVVSLGLASGHGKEALAIARGMAMLTYRSPDEFEQRFTGGIQGPAALCCSDAGAYLRARGEAFRSVMSPQRFLSLSASIDRHRVEPERIQVPCLVIGAENDQLVFQDQLRQLAARLSGRAELHLLDSIYGHDMFLKEAERIGHLVAPFLAATL
jgi:homoserine O-acetyltransferase